MTALRERLVAAIRARGPIGFDEFVEAALYDPAEGYYARTTPGPSGDFVTSPHVSEAFGMLVAKALREAWRALGEPDPFEVAEVGAGDGTLASQVLETAASDPAFARALRLVAIERSAPARAGLEARGIVVRDRLPGRITGCVLANELLDNMPFRLVRLAPGGSPVEVRVGFRDGRFVEVEEPADPDLVPAGLAAGDEYPVSGAGTAFIADLSGALTRGYAFLFDYGFVPGERPGPVRGFRGHRAIEDILADPGSADITAPVDFGSLAAAARGVGMDVHGPVRQRDALQALGFRVLSHNLRAEEDARAGATALRLLSARADAARLVDPDGLGSVRLLVLATPGLPPPLAVRA